MNPVAARQAVPLACRRDHRGALPPASRRPIGRSLRSWPRLARTARSAGRADRRVRVPRQHCLSGNLTQVLNSFPAQYDPSEPTSLLVFQDGQWYLDPEGAVRAAIVLDNLLHRGDIPVTIGVFVDPGVLAGADDTKNRNVEYDAFDDRYITFLLTEIIPTAGATRSPRTRTGGASAGVAAVATAHSRPHGCARTHFAASCPATPAGDLATSTNPHMFIHLRNWSHHGQVARLDRYPARHVTTGHPP